MSASPFRRLEERERDFRAPEPLLPHLESVRAFLREELAETPAAEMSLARAGLTLAAAWEGDFSPPRLIPLAAGVEMIYSALTVQQSALRPGDAVDLFGILSQDLVLARALDLYTTDGNPRVMDAVSRGASRLCEALMAERSGESAAATAHLLGDFHGACARVGSAASGEGESREEGVAGRVRERFGLSFNLHHARKESSPGAAKGHETHSGLLEEYLRRWLGPMPGAS